LISIAGITVFNGSSPAMILAAGTTGNHRGVGCQQVAKSQQRRSFVNLRLLIYDVSRAFFLSPAAASYYFRGSDDCAQCAWPSSARPHEWHRLRARGCATYAPENAAE